MDVEPQAQPVQEVAAAFLHGANRDEPSPQRLPIDEQVRQNRALREQAQFLIDNANAVLPCDNRGTDYDRDTVELNLAGIWTNDACEHLHQRRLAGAIFPHDGMNVAAMHEKIHAVDRDNAAIAFSQAADGNQRRVHHLSIRTGRRAGPGRAVPLTALQPRSAPSPRSSCQRQDRSRIATMACRKSPSPSGLPTLPEAP